jgi:hypothetical protein
VKRLLSLAVVLLMIGLPELANAQSATRIVEDFSGGVIGAEPTSFNPQAGFWSIAVDNDRPVLLEDGSRWEGSGGMAASIAAQARALYGERWNEFIDDLAQAAYFPLAEFNKVDRFTSGTLSVRFKVLGGSLEQDSGLAFNIQDNGDFLALKSDTIEHNMVLYQSIQGQVLSLHRIPNVQTSPGEWHEQQLVVSGSCVTGLLDGQVWLTAELEAAPSGRVGVFAKRDTVVIFSDFSVDPTATGVPAQARPASPSQAVVSVPTGNLGQAVNWARNAELAKAHGEFLEFIDDWDSVRDAVRQRAPGVADTIAAAVAEARRVLVDSRPAPSPAAYIETLERLQQTVREQQARLD